MVWNPSSLKPRNFIFVLFHPKCFICLFIKRVMSTLPANEGGQLCCRCRLSYNYTKSNLIRPNSFTYMLLWKNCSPSLKWSIINVLASYFLTDPDTSRRHSVLSISCQVKLAKVSKEGYCGSAYPTKAKNLSVISLSFLIRRINSSHFFSLPYNWPALKLSIVN